MPATTWSRWAAGRKAHANLSQLEEVRFVECGWQRRKGPATQVRPRSSPTLSKNRTPQDASRLRTSRCASSLGAPARLQVLVGNKSDMDESKRAVPYSRGQALADEFRMQFFETSAKNSTNVDEVFQVGLARPAACPGLRWCAPVAPAPISRQSRAVIEGALVGRTLAHCFSAPVCGPQLCHLATALPV